MLSWCADYVCLLLVTGIQGYQRRGIAVYMTDKDSNHDATLVIHAGGFQVQREQLYGLPIPESTPTWKPLAHHLLVDSIHEEAARRGIVVKREMYALQRQKNMLVGIMVLDWAGTDEFATCLAFRHSNDMSEAIKLYAGVRVFACDNTSVSGNEIILKKKHTHGFAIHREMPEAFDRYQEGTLTLRKSIEDLRNDGVDTPRAREIVFDIFRKKLVPIKLFHPVVQEWYAGEEKTPGQQNMWMLHNHFTAAAKRLKAEPFMNAQGKIGKYFGLGKISQQEKEQAIEAEFAVV